MAWGLWCSVRRGWREFKRRQAPVPWLLTLYAVVGGLSAVTAWRGNATLVVLELAVLSVLLSVFGVADFFRGISERLILSLPAERQEEVAA